MLGANLGLLLYGEVSVVSFSLSVEIATDLDSFSIVFIMMVAWMHFIMVTWINYGCG